MSASVIQLVTGATGLVGYHVVQALLKRGLQVRVLARTPADARALLGPQVDVAQGDVTDPASLGSACVGVERVYHAAGLPEQWLPNTERFHEVNVEGTANVLDAAREAQVRRVIYTSTIDVFEGRRGEVYDERRLDPRPKGTAYERSKQEADARVVAACRAGMDAIFIHPSAVFGPGPLRSPGTNRFIQDLARGNLPALPPGGCPIVYGPDLGEGTVMAAERAEPGARYILSDDYCSLRQLAEHVAELTGCRVPPSLPLWLAHAVSATTELGARLVRKPPLLPAGQLHFLQWGARPSADKARRELGWQPTPLREALPPTLAALT